VEPQEEEKKFWLEVEKDLVFEDISVDSILNQRTIDKEDERGTYTQLGPRWVHEECNKRVKRSSSSSSSMAFRRTL